MEFVLPRAYEEILERNFEDEATILKNDNYINILLNIHKNDKLKDDNNQYNKEDYLFLLDKAYIKKKKDTFFLSTKGIQFLNLLGIKSKEIFIEESKLNNDIKDKIFNYYDLLKKTTIEIFRNLKFDKKYSNLFYSYDQGNYTLECKVVINCLIDLNNFLINLIPILKKEDKLILYYQTIPQRKKYLLKNKNFIYQILFPLIDFGRKKLKFYFINKRKSKYLLFYNLKYSRAEVLGRLIYCGYEIIEDTNGINFNKLVVNSSNKEAVGQEIKNYNSSFIKIKRVGKHGKTIYIYKFRTMYPYSEFLTNYLYQNLNLRKDGHLIGDFRVSRLGEFLRVYWLDEIPMIINFLKGDIKLIGVRPLSARYLELYPKDIYMKRLKYKPGLIHPFYADLPTTMDELFQSEITYLNSYEKRPIVTDFKYFFKYIYNIFFKRYRSA